MSWLHISVVALTLAAAGTAAAAWQLRQHEGRLHDRAVMLTGGNPDRGRILFTGYGCNACHQLRGATQAASLVGPPLDGIGGRVVLAGRLSNRPEQLMAWIARPQRISPGTAMPDLGVRPDEARDIAAYLYTRE